MKFKAVIFDLDGTLLDTLKDLADTGNGVLQELGFQPHPIEAYKHFVGNGLRVLVERIVPEEAHSKELIDKAVARFSDDYARRWDLTSALYPGIAAMLDELSRRKVRLAVLSNKPDPFTRVCVERFLDGYHFSAVFGERPGVAKKPDPAGAEEIVENLKLPKESILYVGDSAVDMQTAKAAGLTGVGVLWGFRDEQELREAGAGYIINHPQELVAIVGS